MSFHLYFFAICFPSGVHLWFYWLLERSQIPSCPRELQTCTRLMQGWVASAGWHRPGGIGRVASAGWHRPGGIGRVASAGWHRPGGIGRVASAGWHRPGGIGRVASAGWHRSGGIGRVASAGWHRPGGPPNKNPGYAGARMWLVQITWITTNVAGHTEGGGLATL